MSRRVLLAEDEADARELLVRGLRRQGWDAHGACDGDAAAARLGEGWDAVVTDLVMPGRDGLGLLAACRLDCPGAVRLVITAFGDKERVLAALNAGAAYLLEKPFSASQLDQALHRVLDRREEAEGVDRLFAHRLSTLPLTPRERELVTLVLKGLGNAEIAGALGLGEQSVKNALSTAYRRLGVASRGELFHRVFPL